MRRCAIAASLLLTASVPTLAQNLDALRDGLSHLPATVLVQEHGDLAYFVDVNALSELGTADSAIRPFFRLMLGADINALASLSRTEAAEWEAKAGIGLDKLRYFTGYGRPPNVVSFWGLSDEAASTDMIANLRALGFDDRGAAGVVGNGEPMRVDPASRDASDPWRTMVGAAQFAAPSGSNVVQAGTPEAAMQAAAEQPRLADNPVIETALVGLEHSAGEGSIVQAVVISPLFGMMGIDPASVMLRSANIEETRKRIEEQMAALGQGIPPYLGGIVADVQSDSQGVAIALTYPDCAIAQEAADAIARRWVEMAGEAAQGEMVSETAEGADGLCAAAFSISVEADSLEQNPAYRAVLEPYMRSQAGVLQIGES